MKHTPDDDASERGKREHVARTVFALGLSVLTIVASCAFLAVRSVVDSGHWVEHTLAVGKEIDVFRSSVDKCAATTLEFLVTGDDGAFREQGVTRNIVTRELEALQRLTVDNASQQQRIEGLRHALDDNFAVDTVLVTQRLHGGWEAARVLLVVATAGGGTSALRAVRSLVDAMTAEEERLLSARGRRASEDAWRATMLGGGTGVFAFAVMTVGLTLLRRDAGVRRIALDRIRRSEESLATTLDSIGDGVIATDDEGRIVRMNPVAESLTGWRAEDARARSLGEVFRMRDERTQAAVEAPLERVLRGGETVNGFSAHTLLVSRDGTERSITESGAPIRDASAATRGMVLVFRDRTAARKAEVALAETEERLAEVGRAFRESQARLSALYDADIIGIIITTLDGRVIEVNDALLDALGFSREEFLSGTIPWHALTPPEWRDLDESALTALRTTGVQGLREKELLRKDGARVPMMVGSKLLAGTGEEVISFALDLTESKQAAIAVAHLREVRASESMFRGLLEAAPDAVVITNADGIIRLVNGQTERLFGYPRDELIGRPADVLVPEYFADACGRTIGSGVELSARRKDGGQFWIEMSLGNLGTEGGTLVLASIRDVSARRRAEQALASAKVAADVAARELEGFSYSVAHDLRGPLRGMNGFAQALIDEYEDEIDADGRVWLQQILVNARKMGSLIDALLSLAQLTRIEIHSERVDLSALVRASAKHLAAASAGRVVELTVEDHVVATLDPVLARSLIDNLLANAWKFTANAGIARVEFGTTERDGRRVCFVRDNGAGFDMAFAGKLFQPFQRLHTVVEFAGTGIGLATVERIVRRHEGRIWGEGSVNAGATFYFYFPAKPSGARA